MESLQSLIDLISRHAPTDGIHDTPIPGVSLVRSGKPTIPMPVVYEPTLCLIAQGRKHVVAGSARSLVQLLTPTALALARQMLGKPEDAEDAVQESFLRLWSARPEDLHGAQLSTYFNTIVLNRCRTQLVRRRELTMAPDDLVVLQDLQQAHADAAGTQAWDAVTPQQLLDTLAQLPARQRLALAMWAYADASAADIAQALEIDANSAHQLLHRARAGLRHALKGAAT